jgi:chemotaxis protein MotB
MSRKKQHAEHENAERWLLTYADLITLLLGLFVILYAMSQVDAKKFQDVMAAFGKIFNGGSAIMNAGGGAGVIEMPVPAKGSGEGDGGMSRQVQSSIEDAIQQGRITVSESARGLTVHVTEKLLFDRGQAELRAEAVPVLEALGKSLEKLPNEVRVEGHTDDSPIHSDAYPDNWHLSVARALNVGLYLVGHSELKPQRMGIVGYGEFRPIAPNDSDQNKARNRRVDIVIVK